MKAEHRSAVDVKLRQHYDTVWSADDPWSFDTSEYEQRRFANQLSLLSDRRYKQALEIGCGAGAFSRQLAGLTDRLLAVDISEVAIGRARADNTELKNTTFLAANIMDFNLRAEGPWDLVVLSETIYCLGWLYPLFDVGWMLSQLRDAMAPEGRLLLSNTFGKERDYLLRPWLIKTYHDLVRHVGLELEFDDIFEAAKEGTTFQVLTSRFKLANSSSLVQPDNYVFTKES